MTLEFSGVQAPESFMAGVGRAVITPPAGHPICGPEHPERPSAGVADDLLAKVLFVRSGDDRAALVSLDAWGLSAVAHEAIASTVAEATGATPGHVWITVTGNGTSPCLWDDRPRYERYAAYLPELVGGAAVMAAGDMQPASVSTAAARLPEVSTSLEGPGRPGDEALFAVGFNDEEGDAIGRVVNFSCPATVAGPHADWTADYPGYSMWALEQGGGLALFAQGASADIRPFDWYKGNTAPSHSARGASDVHALGLLLATQVAQAMAGAMSRRNAPLADAHDAGLGLHVLRIGPAVFISARAAQPSRFARHIRRDLPGSTVVVSANIGGSPFGAVPELDDTLQRRAVELAHETGAR